MISHTVSQIISFIRSYLEPPDHVIDNLCWLLFSSLISSLQEDVGSLLMHLFEPAFDSCASRSFGLSTPLLAVIQQPFKEALCNYADPSKEAHEWLPCAPKVRGKY